MPFRRRSLVGFVQLALAGCSDPAPAERTASAPSTVSVAAPPARSAAPLAPSASAKPSATARPEVPPVAHALAHAPEDVRTWLKDVPELPSVSHPGGRSFTISLPKGARLEPGGRGEAGWWTFGEGNAKAAMKLRRTATLHDPTTTFDSFPDCPTPASARAAAMQHEVILDRAWDVPAQLGAAGSRVDVVVYRDDDQLGVYCWAAFVDPGDKVAYESETHLCVGPGSPSDIVAQTGRVSESAARTLVAICLGSYTEPP
jgi:hypothetical protein